MSYSSPPLRLIGSGLLNLLTAGIHTSPLSIYREYLQNAADSISSSKNKNGGKVQINIDVSEMRVSIHDNGLGLSHTQALRELVPIADSKKHRGTARGFRGIGRLSGLGFGDMVTFLTRQRAKAPVTRICWNSAKLKKCIASRLPLESVIEECVEIEKISSNHFPAHFFQVEISGINRHSAGEILNREAVRNYISEVCPIPFPLDFPYASSVGSLFDDDRDFLTLDVFLNGDDEPISRRHSAELSFTKGKKDKFTEFEKIAIPTLDGNGKAAIGWIAHSSYLGTLPSHLGIRGVRAREGNIQIGDENIFEHLFLESRFNRWCVAEIHILDSRIVPNGRRDYFESSPHTRNLENHIRTMAGMLEKRCRAASKERNRIRRFQSFVKDVEATYALATSKYLTAVVARELINKKLIEIEKMKKRLNTSMSTDDRASVLNKLEKMLQEFRVRSGPVSFPGVKPVSVKMYRQIFNFIARNSPSPSVAMQMIETIMEEVKESV